VHGTLALLPVALLVAAAVAEVVARTSGRKGWASLARGLLGAGLVTVLLTAFTGLDARKALPSEGSEAMAGVDRHVLVAIVLLLPLAGAAVYRLRMDGALEKRVPWLAPVLTSICAVLAVTILWMGATGR